MTIGEAPASSVREVRASAAVADALLAAVHVARDQLDATGEVRPRTWDAIDDLVAALIEALPERRWGATGPQNDQDHPKVAPAVTRPGERTR